LPFEESAYRGWAAVAAVLHRETPTPAQRLGQLSDTQQTLAELRCTTVPRLRRELSGDLGYIVSRAMEKDRSHRYETANGLTLDLERFLADQPVRARGAGAAYVLRKFVRRNQVGVAFAATLAVSLVGFSVVTAIQAGRIARARDEAESRRGQAEGLIDFMLSDLREKLEPIGRLEILEDVGDQATRYFSSIPEDQFSEDELASRSKALYQIGKVRLDQNDSESAVKAFAESLRLARALSGREPDNPDRLLGLSQSHYYVGFASWRAGDLDVAEEEFLGYLAAAKRLVELDPENLEYRLELGFAHGNLGSVREARGDLAGATEAYALSLEAKRSLVAADSTNVDWMGELAETYNKLGVVARRRGDYAGALAQHQMELALKRTISEREPEHAYWRSRFAIAFGFLAAVREATGGLEEGLDLRRQQVSVLDSLFSYDPSNRDWGGALAVAQRRLAKALFGLGHITEAEATLGQAEGELAGLAAADSTGFGWRADLAAVKTLRANIALAERRPTDALAAAEAATTLVTGEPHTTVDRAQTVAAAHLARGHALEALHRPEDARWAWESAFAAMEPFLNGPERADFRPLLVETLLSLDRGEEAQEELAELLASGYRNTELEKLAGRRNPVGGDNKN
jgi:tetratricopeptide (TPR) repeat protein